MADRQNSFEGDQFSFLHGRESNRGLVRIDGRPFESPRGRRRGNPGLGRENGMPFVSQRGRGRVIPSTARVPQTAREDTASRTFNTEEERTGHNDHDLRHVQSNMTSSDGRLLYSGLTRYDNRQFESPRGSGRNNPSWGRVGGRPFVSQRGRIGHHGRSINTYTASAPSYEAIMDVE